ncbi:DUF5635 domain-containing protein [uncultured Amnibacterium sp.]|uniref:DUF5635 domain-containing protein n=1 Tax=uncultured Amnibacterium sp. TaxID=1631851 RepID=UPI0035C9AA9A
MSIFRELVEARDRLQVLVDELLQSLDRGETPRLPEGEHIDCKEEPYRRGAGGTLLPGEKQNNAAAAYLADEVCCMANTPGGGAIVLGVEDGTWQILGTEIDPDWLRLRIYQLSHVAPTTEAREVQGLRVIVLYVAEAPEPVEDKNGRIRWRVSDSCQPVDRAEWWLSRQRGNGADAMASITTRTVDEVTPGAIQAARRYVNASGDPNVVAGGTSDEILRRLGIITVDRRLTQAGVLLFCPAGRPLLTLTRLDVVGGNVVNSFEPDPEQSLLEQLAQIENRLDAMVPSRPDVRTFVEGPIRALPTRAVREAILNGLTHRDWMRFEPTTVRWIDADSRLEVESPGGFTGGMSEHNVLSRRHARYPALSDLFRALRLVDKEGIGVDRMYREMTVLGHRPPSITEVPGPLVRTVLEGGQPAVPVMAVVEAVRPEVRQRDVRIALILFTLLHAPFLTRRDVAELLQDDDAEADSALAAAEQTSIGGRALITGYKDVWTLGAGALEIAEREIRQRGPSSRRGLLAYRRPTLENGRQVVLAWLARHERIGSGDYAALTGVQQSNASRFLTGLVGDLLLKGTSPGYSHFVRRPTQTPDGPRHGAA